MSSVIASSSGRSIVQETAVRIFTIILAASLFGSLGCESYEAPPTPASQQSSAVGASPSAFPSASMAGTSQGPVILGYDDALRREMQAVCAQFLDEKMKLMPVPEGAEVPSDFNVNDVVDAMVNHWNDVFQEVAVEFGIEPDAWGNYTWPEELRTVIIDPMREKFESMELYDEMGDIPAMAAPLAKEHQAGTITPARKELLFLMLVAKYAPQFA